MPKKSRRLSRVNSSTPIRRALVPGSRLRDLVRNGIDAIERSHHDYIDLGVRSVFSDSLALDDAMQEEYPHQNRWDYLLGHGSSDLLIGLEPHSAKEDQVSRVILKRRAAIDQVTPHLRAGRKIDAWMWVASGKVYFADTEKTKLRLF